MVHSKLVFGDHAPCHKRIMAYPNDSLTERLRTVSSCSLLADRQRYSCLLVLVMMVCLIGGCTAQKGESTIPLAVAQVTAADGMSYALVPGTCSEGGCASLIQLWSGTKMLDSVALSFAASQAALSPETRENRLPVHSLEAWTAGMEEGTVTTAIQPVKLTSKRIGLLVHQAGGFEHVKRRHDLFLNDGGKLKRIWSAEEGVGPAWSAAEVRRAGIQSTDEVVYLEGFRPGGDEVDTLTGRRLAWNEATNDVTDQLLKRLPAITAGEYANVDAARQASSVSCMARYWVLPAERFGGKAGKSALAFVAVNEHDINEELARSCKGGAVRSKAEYASPDR